LSDEDWYARLDALVEWMRKRGVVTVETEEVRMSLGPEPATAPSPPPTLTDAEIAARVKRAKEHQDALLFASSEGFPEFEDE
jgi:hypothetical protein